MPQNRNKLLDLLIGNLANSIIHKVLEISISEEIELANKYNKEETNSFTIAKRYREKVNPINAPLPEQDAEYIKNQIIKKVKSELMIRISKGYKNIKLDLIEELTISSMKELSLIN
ncbi:MAG: hypothetical protein WC781_04295 [Candidatus Pacearchaeota archaeon]|jgi:hypothetical protein